MISLCSVIYDNFSPLVKILVDSVAKRCPRVDEIVLANNDRPLGYCHEEKVGHVTVKTYGHPLRAVYENMRVVGVAPLDHGHALGMHYALDHATREYVLFSDPDVFFTSDAPGFYLDCLKKYDLNIVGVSHHWAHALAGTYFPYVINCLVRRDALPGPDWHAGYLRARINSTRLPEARVVDPGYPVPGKWLVGSPLMQFQHLYPRGQEDPIFDIGCNLWLWNHERQGRWLSFQTLDVHNYYSNVYKTNFGLRERLFGTRLLYHLSGGYHALNKPGAVEEYEREYNK